MSAVETPHGFVQGVSEVQLLVNVYEVKRTGSSHVRPHSEQEIKAGPKLKRTET